MIGPIPGTVITRWQASSCSAIREQTNIVSKRGELTGDVMRSRTRFHADQTARNVGEPALKLSARAFELPNNRPALIEADKVEAILTEIDADRADGGWCGFV
jgi:hypothetical protein